MELEGSLSVSLRDRRVERHERPPEDWTVHLLETGLDTMVVKCGPTATDS